MSFVRILVASTTFDYGGRVLGATMGGGSAMTPPEPRVVDRQWVGLAVVGGGGGLECWVVKLVAQTKAFPCLLALCISTPSSAMSSTGGEYFILFA